MGTGERRRKRDKQGWEHPKANQPLLEGLLSPFFLAFSSIFPAFPITPSWWKILATEGLGIWEEKQIREYKNVLKHLEKELSGYYFQKWSIRHNRNPKNYKMGTK